MSTPPTYSLGTSNVDRRCVKSSNPYFMPWLPSLLIWQVSCIVLNRAYGKVGGTYTLIHPHRRKEDLEILWHIMVRVRDNYECKLRKLTRDVIHCVVEYEIPADRFINDWGNVHVSARCWASAGNRRCFSLTLLLYGLVFSESIEDKRVIPV